MKITRLRRGYRIHLSDTEFRALCFLVNLGATDLEGMNDHEVPGTLAMKRLLFRGRFAEFAAMGIDEDRRGEAAR
jgi:hypothetical protein